MTVTSHTRRQQGAAGPAWMRRRPRAHDALLAALMVTLIAAGIVTLVLVASGLQGAAPPSLVATLWHSTTARPRLGAAPPVEPAAARAPQEPAVAVEAPSAETVSRESGPPLPVLAVGGRARVVKTDGVGVILYAAPRADARRPSGLLEGTIITVLELAGGEWARVRSDTQQAGWVRTLFLAPAD